MDNKFKVYAQTRATRQLAGDVKESIGYGKEDYKAWEEIEDILMRLESKLERMNLKD
jgi:hypothetical protein